MRKRARELNSKQYGSGHLDLWWFNISSPSKLTSQDVIHLSLWDHANQNLVKESVLDLRKNWLSRIRQASTHFYLQTEICKVHIQRRLGTNQFVIYFGKKEDGVYSLPDG